MKSQEEKKGRTPDGHKESFKLPRSIVQVLRECAKKHGGGVAAASETLKYLWVSIAGDPRKNNGHKRKETQCPLSNDEWLSVVDEAASLGVKYIIICTGEFLEDHSALWSICKWAQQSYKIDIGIHTCAKKLKKSVIGEMQKLDARRTCLFVNDAESPTFEPLREFGISVLKAHVDHEEQSPPCDMSEQMIFVSPEGILYTCGLVSDEEQFRLGHVADKPIEEYVKDPSLPHTIPEWAPHRENGCDACPPIMVKRMMEAAARQR
jgi:radical SAM protein with 4Fe4S-binding SPASM domain